MIASQPDGGVNQFFDGSTEGVLAAFLEMESSQLSAEELDRLSELIEQAKREGR